MEKFLTESTLGARQNIFEKDPISPIPNGFSINLQSTGTTQTSIGMKPLQKDFQRIDFGIDVIRRITSIENKMKKLEDFFSINLAPINTLGDSKWELKQGLNVAIERREIDDFVACLYDIDLYGYGDSVPEALEDLKVSMVNQFEYLIEKNEKIQLANSMIKQLKFLKNILVRKDV